MEVVYYSLSDPSTDKPSGNIFNCHICKARHSCFPEIEAHYLSKHKNVIIVVQTEKQINIRRHFVGPKSKRPDCRTPIRSIKTASRLKLLKRKSKSSTLSTSTTPPVDITESLANCNIKSSIDMTPPPITPDYGNLNSTETGERRRSLLKRKLKTSPIFSIDPPESPMKPYSGQLDFVSGMHVESPTSIWPSAQAAEYSMDRDLEMKIEAEWGFMADIPEPPDEFLNLLSCPEPLIMGLSPVESSRHELVNPSSESSTAANEITLKLSPVSYPEIDDAQLDEVLDFALHLEEEVAKAALQNRVLHLFQE